MCNPRRSATLARTYTTIRGTGLKKNSGSSSAITRTVLVLSLVSLLTDVSSEMLYPVMPIYLKSIGFSILLIGILEGVAEAAAGLSKGYFGQMSDTTGKRLPFIRGGYLLSALSKPMMAAFLWPLWIFFARTLDRLGKGLRTAARDALLSDEATPATKGRIFGFHRSLDTLGAVLGPVAALLFLHFLPEKYRLLFLVAFVPGIGAMLLTFLLKEKKRTPATEGRPRTPFFQFLRYWQRSPASYKRLVMPLLLFTLFNSSDIFLLLKVKETGLNDTEVIGIYILYNIVYALFSYPIGILADKIGLKKTFVAGLALFAAVYFGMATNMRVEGYIVLFCVYGLYAAATEGISKAWITNISARTDTATAIGTYTALQSVCTMGASTIAGFIWFRYGAGATFLLSASVAAIVAAILASVRFGEETVGGQ